MARFGFGKKKEKDSDANSNPYAQTSAEDPYAAPLTPFQQAKAAQTPGGRPGASGGLPGGPAPQRASSGSVPPPYSSSSYQPSNGYGDEKSTPVGGYGNDRYGAPNGYGSNRYGSPNTDQAPTRSARGPGGYGGLGGGDDDDTNSNALFGNARERYVPPSNQQGGGAPPPGPSGNRGGYGAGYGDDSNKNQLFGGAGDRYAQRQQGGGEGPGDNDPYGGYGEQRELTQEEREDQEYQDTKGQTKQIKEESLSSIQRSVAIARGAQATMQGTLVNLASQRDRLANTERNLDQAAAQSRIAEDKTKELKKLNGSMFAIHHESKKARQLREGATLERHRMERDTREATRKDAYSANQRMEDNFKEMRGPGGRKLLGSKRDPNERSKYEMSDDDDEAKAMEDGIEDGQEELAEALAALKVGAVAMGREVEESIKTVDRIGAKSDAVDDHVRMNRDKLSRIR